MTMQPYASPLQAVKPVGSELEDQAEHLYERAQDLALANKKLAWAVDRVHQDQIKNEQTIADLKARWEAIPVLLHQIAENAEEILVRFTSESRHDCRAIEMWERFERCEVALQMESAAKILEAGHMPADDCLACMEDGKDRCDRCVHCADGSPTHGHNCDGQCEPALSDRREEIAERRAEAFEDYF